MTKIIIAGSSHVAALKAAWDICASDFPDLEFHFFATHVLYFPRLEITPDGQLHPPQPTFKAPGVAGNISEHLTRLNGTTSCDLTAYDAIVWSCFTAGALDNETPHYSIFRLLQTYDVTGLRETGNPRLLGRATFDAILRGQARHQILPQDWRKPGLPPVYALFAPAPSETLRASTGKRLQPLREIQQNPQGSAIALASFVDMIDENLQQQGVPLIRQPAETLDQAGLTLQRYNDNPINIARHSKEFDPRHMNAEYGRLCLHAIAERVGTGQTT